MATRRIRAPRTFPASASWRPSYSGFPWHTTAIRLSGYTEQEKLEIAKRHLLPAILDAHGLKERPVAIDDDTILGVIRDYTAEAGVPSLERKLAGIVRKIIEATRMQGSGRPIVTGQLGDVMRESVSAAYSYVRSKARDLEIDDEAFGDTDIHIHFPAGAIPKDGPSAGVAIATTIASVMGDKPVRHDVAMTGEITLRGKVLSVGGVKEKVLAAQRANIRRVVLPEGNRRDLTEVPEAVKAGLEFVFAERVEDVWREALIPLYVVRSSRRKYDQSEYDSERHRPDGR